MEQTDSGSSTCQIFAHLVSFGLMDMSSSVIGFNKQQDGPSLESSSYLNVTLRYLGPLDPRTMGPWDALTFQSWTLGLLDFRTLGPFPSSTTSS